MKTAAQVTSPAPPTPSRAKAGVPVVCGYQVEGDLKATLHRTLQKSGFYEKLASWPRLVLKPNLGWDTGFPGSVTSGQFLKALAELVAPRVDELILAEADQVLVSAEKAARKAGIFDWAPRLPNCRFVNLSRAYQVDLPTRLSHPRTVRVPLLLLSTPMVSVPVLKTHGRCLVSLSLKNQWGCMDKARHHLHPFLNEVIAEVNRLLKPQFAIMDGLVAMEGNGPKTGEPRRADLVLASEDLVALDSVATRLLGFDPRRVGHITAAARAGVGRESPVRLAGDLADGLRFCFRPGRNNGVALVEMLLRSSRLRRLVFHTPLFELMCLGAKAYYFLWMYGPAGGWLKRRRFLSLLGAEE